MPSTESVLLYLDTQYLLKDHPVHKVVFKGAFAYGRVWSSWCDPVRLIEDVKTQLQAILYTLYQIQHIQLVHLYWVEVFGQGCDYMEMWSEVFEKCGTVEHFL